MGVYHAIAHFFGTPSYAGAPRWLIGLVALYAMLEWALGRSDKLKANSTVALVAQFLGFVLGLIPGAGPLLAKAMEWLARPAGAPAQGAGGVVPLRSSGSSGRALVMVLAILVSAIMSIAVIVALAITLGGCAGTNANAPLNSPPTIGECNEDHAEAIGFTSTGFTLVSLGATTAAVSLEFSSASTAGKTLLGISIAAPLLGAAFAYAGTDASTRYTKRCSSAGAPPLPSPAPLVRDGEGRFVVGAAP